MKLITYNEPVWPWPNRRSEVISTYEPGLSEYAVEALERQTLPSGRHMIRMDNPATACKILVAATLYGYNWI